MSEGISVSKTGLATALENYQTLSSGLATQIEKVRNAIEIIEDNWKGPEHTAAHTDYTNADKNMTTAETILTSMEGAVIKLSANANKIQYN